MSANPYARRVDVEAEFDRALYRLASALPRDEVGVQNSFRAVWELWKVLREGHRGDPYGERFMACVRLMGEYAATQERLHEYRSTGEC